MPIVFRDSDLRYFFFPNEGSPREPLKGSGGDTKIWLEPDVSVADSYGFRTTSTDLILKEVPRGFLRVTVSKDGRGDGACCRFVLIFGNVYVTANHARASLLCR